MSTRPSPEAAAASLDAARQALAEAGHRLTVAAALADDLDARTRWVSPAASVFREGLGAWCDELRACRLQLEDIGDELRVARTRALSGAVG
ncbi:hypothetical protein [Microbacterium sp. SORGH_AS_0888]|uniref:hypothetical protein n=1 Tax=Microbacterium sp. SORGH_AS_0888 TaxID=3041791 RepID=UPI0027828398|nr:hypothetical protein [Microbacterium sp. SORGH_AS_0888]MDQ1129842.1 hypothetical protein [Microbacterium sp. SORGH_AS_0888]